MNHKLSKAELVDRVKLIMNAVGSEEDQNELLLAIAQNVPHPNVDGLIYYPDHYGLPDNVTAEQVVEAALSYKPIPLGPARH